MTIPAATVTTNSFRAVRGRSIACVLCDDAAFWRHDVGANPDIEAEPGWAKTPDRVPPA